MCTSNYANHCATYHQLSNLHNDTALIKQLHIDSHCVPYIDYHIVFQNSNSNFPDCTTHEIHLSRSAATIYWLINNIDIMLCWYDIATQLYQWLYYKISWNRGYRHIIYGILYWWFTDHEPGMNNDHGD